jgi:adenylate cyclase
MAEVFVSYAREDEPQATKVADALRAQGYRAWRDDELPAHRTYAEVIQERLNSAEAVVVLWSADAVKSQWVRAEADTARNRGTLIQATLDGTVPPIPFNQVQCANLNNNDPADAPGWPKLIGSVRSLAGASTVETPAQRTRRQQVSVCVLPFAHSTIPLTHLEADPDVDTVRDHPRFRKMLAELRQRLGVDPASPPAEAAAPPHS